MPRQSQAAETESKSRSRPEPGATLAPGQGLPSLAEGALPGTVADQVAHLGDPRLPAAQHVALAARIGHLQGNRFLRGMLAPTTLSIQLQPPSGETATEPNRQINLGTASQGDRLKVIDDILNSSAEERESGDSQLVYTAWATFGYRLPEVAGANMDLWQRSLKFNSDLEDLEAVKSVQDKLGADVTALALSHLDANQRLVEAELEKLGLEADYVEVPTGNKMYGEKWTRSEPVAQASGPMTPEQASQIEDIQAVADGIQVAQALADGLSQIVVGYKTEWKRAGYDYWPVQEPVLFKPWAAPEQPPKGTEDPPLRTWDDVKAQYDRVQGAISYFANKCPSVYDALREGRIKDLAQAEPEQARSIVGKDLVTALENIKKTRPKVKVDGGGLDYHDLKPIHAQLFAGTPGPSSGNMWNQPFYRWAADEELKGYEAKEFWISMGLSSLAAAAFLVAELASAGSATFLIATGVGMGASGTMAVSDWGRYTDLAAAADANVSDEMALVARGDVDTALISAVLDTVGAFLDAAGVASHAIRAARLESGLIPEVALAGTQARAAVGGGLRRLGELGAEEAQQAVGRAVSELGVEEAARQSGKSLDDLLSIVGAESDAGKRIKAFKEASEAGLLNAGELADRMAHLQDLVQAGKRAEADQAVVQAIEQFGPVATLERTGGWDALAATLGNDSLAGRHLNTWRDGVFADLERFVANELPEGQIMRTGTVGKFSNDMDVSLLGPNSAANSDKARSYLAARAGTTPDRLDFLLSAHAYTDPRRMHMYDVLPAALREEAANKAAALQGDLIWNRRLYDARQAGDEVLVSQIQGQMRELGIAEVAFKPLGREDLSRLYQEVDSLHQQLTDAVAAGDVAKQRALVDKLGSAQAQINATEKGAYMGGGVREFVSERAGEKIPILAPGAAPLAAEQLTALLDQLPMLDKAAGGLKAAAGIDDLVAALKGIGKYGDRFTYVTAKALGTKAPNAALLDELANEFQTLFKQAKGEMSVPLQVRLASRDAAEAAVHRANWVLDSFEGASLQAIKKLTAEAGLTDVPGGLAKAQLLTKAHVKLLRAKDAALVQAAAVSRAVSVGVSTTGEAASTEEPAAE